ncbi:uncharacterized protein LOC109399255 [Aedes albopictus]|uniref:4-nitrophenylphosphatase n=1 Tax=Aedes albopictus TaxID=7160 RepID=A0ABM2A4M9_AEDAL
MSTSNCRTSKHLQNLTIEDKKRFLSSFDYIFTDCDGVLWNRYEPIEGVGAAIGALKSLGKHVVYVSNNSIRSFENYRKILQQMGHDVDKVDVIQPVTSVIKYLKSVNFEGLIYAIGTEPFLADLRNAGYEVIHGPTEVQPESLSLIIPKIFDKKPVKAVVVDYDYNCNYPKLLRAELYLKSDPECLLIAGGTDHWTSIRQKINVFGPGHFVDILEKATGRNAIGLGKPGQQLGVQLKEQFGIRDSRRVLFVGDTITQDVAFGKIAGFQTLLVLTGATKVVDVQSFTNQDIVPDYYTESLADLLKMIGDVQNEVSV